LVNDAWYQTSSGPYQHAAQSRYRAVEFRRPMVRVANTGISGVYDPAGRVVARLALNREGAFTALIAPSDEVTFYARYGDLFAWLTVAAAVGLTGWTYRRRFPLDGPEHAA
ncbi:MAG: nitrilase-related carbon-nitrogen hydrolase, partial [Candidatus Neomarinimicrobiota bacterium]